VRTSHALVLSIGGDGHSLN